LADVDSLIVADGGSALDSDLKADIVLTSAQRRHKATSPPQFDRQSVCAFS
jgi:hypothetical protein